MRAEVRQLVRVRANHCCEYCGVGAPDVQPRYLHIEHIIPRKHGGGDEDENLALACLECNLAKSSNLTGIDPDSKSITRLFHPRLDRWQDHFAIQAGIISGLSAIGRTTIYVLDFNRPERIELRRAASNP